MRMARSRLASNIFRTDGSAYPESPLLHHDPLDYFGAFRTFLCAALHLMREVLRFTLAQPVIRNRQENDRHQ